VFGGWAANTPGQRALYASARDPIVTFENHFYRPRGALLKRLSSDVSPELEYLPLGGAGLRGYGRGLALNRVVATNLEARRRLLRPAGPARHLSLWGVAFADVASGSIDPRISVDDGRTFFADAGPGLLLFGRFYDRDVRARLDIPLFAQGRGRSAPSVVLSFNDLW
jgi:hypothetical protein